MPTAKCKLIFQNPNISNKNEELSIYHKHFTGIHIINKHRRCSGMPGLFPDGRGRIYGNDNVQYKG